MIMASVTYAIENWSRTPEWRVGYSQYGIGYLTPPPCVSVSVCVCVTDIEERERESESEKQREREKHTREREQVSCRGTTGREMYAPSGEKRLDRQETLYISQASPQHLQAILIGNFQGESDSNVQRQSLLRKSQNVRGGDCTSRCRV